MSNINTTYGYVYCIKNLLNERLYIGAKFGDPTSIEEYYGSSKLLTPDIKKYGIENFQKIILLKNVQTKDNELDLLEAIAIKEFKSHTSNGGYNITTFGGICRNASDKTKQKMSKTASNRIVSLKTKLKLSKSHIGKILSITHRNNISKSQIGKQRGKKCNWHKHFIFINPDLQIYHPENSFTFCVNNNISYALLREKENNFITRADITKNTKGLINTIGWMQCTVEFAKANNFY